MNFRRRREHSTGNFVGRPTPEWDARKCVAGYFLELAKHHALNDVFSKSLMSFLESDQLFRFSKSLLALCERGDEGGIQNLPLRMAIEEWLNSAESDRPPCSDILEGLFFWAQKLVPAGKLRGILIAAMREAGGAVPTAGEFAAVTAFASLKKAFLLDDNDLSILAFFFCVGNSEELSGVMESWSGTEIHYGISCCTGIPEKACREKLSTQGRIMQNGLLVLGSDIRGRASTENYSLQSSVFLHISMGGEDILCGKFVEQVEGDPFPLETFPVGRTQCASVVDLLSFADGSTHTNILLYGKEGSGKTQFARAASAAAGKKLYAYRQEGNSDRRGTDDIFRLAYVTASLDGSDSVLLIDEAEDLLSTGSCGPFAPAPPAFVKARIHEVLDGARCPIIWIVNHVSRIDASTKRRFAFSIEFSALSPASIRNLAKSWLGDIPISEQLRQRIVTLSGSYGLTGASLQYLSLTLKSVLSTEPSEERAFERVTRLFESNVKLLTGKVPARPELADSYTLDALDTSVDPERLILLAMRAFEKISSSARDGAEARVGLRFLFHGASGTGKTEFARFIARVTDRPLLVKRASDILDPYVGVAEQNVCKIFREAEATRSLLLIDEADSFFSDRSKATYSWERTLVNEFLVQMEEFRGVLICSTNYAAILDKALARRFHETVEFRPLGRGAIANLLAEYYPDLAFGEDDVAAIAESGPVTPGDFGALKGRTIYLEADEVTAAYVVESLSAMGRAKKDDGPARIGFSS